MHLVDTYAHQCSSKVARPFLIRQFYPVPNKYITIHNSGGMASKHYDYYAEVIELIKPKLQELGYEIVQVGAAEDRALEGCVYTHGKSSLAQTFYILENSSLHIGNDSFPIHFCSAFNVPLIGLYSIIQPEVAGPYWKNDKQKIFFPIDYEKERPSYSPKEPQKVVNRIKIEEIAQAVFDILEIGEKVSFKTVYIGARYNDLILESTCDGILHPDFLKDKVVNLRLDYVDSLNMENLVGNLTRRKCAIITDKAFDTEPIKQLRQNVGMIMVKLSDSDEFVQFVKNIRKNGLPFTMIYDGDLPEEVIKARFFEYGGITFLKYPNISELIKVDQIADFDKVSYRTNKILAARGKLYIGHAAFKADQAIEEAANRGLKLNKDALDDLKFDVEHVLVYEK